MTLDLGTAREAFEASTDLTVGIEEEFAILDPGTLDLAGRYEDLVGAAEPGLAELITPDLIRAEIEIRSGRGEDLADALRRQAEARRGLFALAAAPDAPPRATRAHPPARHPQQALIHPPDQPRGARR